MLFKTETNQSFHLPPLNRKYVFKSHLMPTQMICDIIRVWWRLWLSDGHTIIQRYRGKTANKQTIWWSQNDEKICEKNSVKLWKKCENTVENCENMVTLCIIQHYRGKTRNKQAKMRRKTNWWYTAPFLICIVFWSWKSVVMWRRCLYLRDISD